MRTVFCSGLTASRLTRLGCFSFPHFFLRWSTLRYCVWVLFCVLEIYIKLCSILSERLCVFLHLGSACAIPDITSSSVWSCHGSLSVWFPVWRSFPHSRSQCPAMYQRSEYMCGVECLCVCVYKYVCPYFYLMWDTSCYLNCMKSAIQTVSSELNM